MINKIAIVTVHAGETNNLIKTMESVNSQNIKPDLHLIVSKDYDRKILLHQKKYNKFIFKKDKSIYNAMNIGLRNTKNYFLFFLNSGDYLYSRNTIKVIKRFISLYKNKCINFKTILEYKKKRFILFNNTILDIILPNKKQLLVNIYDLKSKEFIIVNNKGFNNGRLIIVKS